jgi:flagellar assembly protein FliH
LFNQGEKTYWEGLPTLERPRPASVPKFEYEPGAAEREAQEILRRAKDEAGSILKEAQNLASNAKSQAQIEADQLKSDARERGAVEGYDRARQEIRDQLISEWTENRDALRADVQLVIDTLTSQRQALWEQTEQDVIAFVLEMAKRVVKVEIQQNPKVVGEMIRHALRRVADKDNIRIRVSPDELQAIRSDRKELLLVLDGARQLEIVDDRRIGRGGCVIETSAGTVDARVETQFGQIADKLGIASMVGDESE